MRNSLAMIPAKAGISLLALAALLCGCGGGGEFATAPVSGTVTHNGDPVKGGSLTFSPVASGQEEAGKPASATINNDGTYALGTYGEEDGAVVGKHTVSYSAPAGEPSADAAGGHDQAAPSPYQGLRPKQSEVEVPPGGATIEIELVK